MFSLPWLSKPWFNSKCYISHVSPLKFLPKAVEMINVILPNSLQIGFFNIFINDWMKKWRQCSSISRWHIIGRYVFNTLAERNKIQNNLHRLEKLDDKDRVEFSRDQHCHLFINLRFQNHRAHILWHYRVSPSFFSL